MIKKLAEGSGLTYKWKDLFNPVTDEVHQVAEQYGLHEASVKMSRSRIIFPYMSV